jgi:enoyl-CoA hydratase/carnithine racemase
MDKSGIARNAEGVMYQSFEYSLSDGIALVRLNRPNKLNAIDQVMVREFGELCANLRADREVRVVIFTGNARILGVSTVSRPAATS